MAVGQEFKAINELRGETGYDGMIYLVFLAWNTRNEKNSMDFEKMKIVLPSVLSQTVINSQYGSVKDLCEELYNTLVEEIQSYNNYCDRYKSLATLVHTMTQEGVVQIIDDLCEAYIYPRGRNIAPIGLPKELSNLMVSQVEGIPQSVYIPFANRMDLNIVIKADTVVSQTMNSKAWAMGCIRMLLRGKDISQCRLENSSQHWLGSEHGKKYNLIISAPWFRPFLERNSENKYRTVEDFLLGNGLNSLTDDGQMVLCTYSNALTRFGLDLKRRYKDSGLTRQELISKLDKIILVPSPLEMRTRVVSTILVFAKNKTMDDPITFVNAQASSIREGSSSKLNLDEVLEILKSEPSEKVFRYSKSDFLNHEWFNFNPLIYVEKKTLQNGNDEMKTVGDYLTPFAINPSNRIRIRKEKNYRETVRLFNYAAYSKKWDNYVVDYEDLEQKEINYPSAIDLIKLDRPCIAVSLKNSSEINVAIIQASNEKPIYIRRLFFYLYELCSKEISPVYFVSELKNQYESYLEKGWILEESATFRLSMSMRETLLAIPISIPPFSEQLRRVKAMMAEHQKAKIRELGLESLLDSKKEEYIQTLRMRKHDMSQDLAGLTNGLENLSIYFANNSEGEAELDPFTKTTVSEQIKALIANTRTLTQLISNMGNLERYGKKEDIDIDAFLNNIQPSSPKYLVNFTNHIKEEMENTLPEEEEQMNEPLEFHVLFNRLALERLVQNILNNAETHGFVDDNRHDYTIQIDMSLDALANRYNIAFSNNGKPMPHHFEVQQYKLDGGKAGLTAKTGHGGYIINEIAEQYNGSIEVINDEHAEYPVTIVLSIPRNT